MEEFFGLPSAAWGLAGHQSVGGEQLRCASLAFVYMCRSIIIITSFFSSSFSVLASSFYLNP